MGADTGMAMDVLSPARTSSASGVPRGGVYSVGDSDATSASTGTPSGISNDSDSGGLRNTIRHVRRW